MIGYIQDSKPLTEEEKKYLKEHGNLVYGADQNAPPLRYVDGQSNQYKGILIDYVNMLSIEIGTQIDVKPLVWENALDELKLGTTDMCDMFKSEKRKKDYLFSNPIYKLRGVIVTNKNNQDINSYVGLKGKKVALQKGDYSNEFLETKVKDGNYIYTNDINSALKLLIEGKVDAVVGDEPVCSYFIDKNDYKDKLTIVEYPVYEEEVVLAIPKSEIILLNILNKGITSLNKQGTMEKMQQKWFGISTPIMETKSGNQILSIIISTLVFIFSMITYLFYMWNISLKKAVDKRTNELQSTFDVFNSFMLIINKEGKILNANKSFIEYYKLEKKSIIGERIYNTNHMLNQIWYEENYIKNSIDNGDYQKLEYSYKGKVYVIKINPIKDNNSNIINILLIIKDVTRIKITERQFLQSNKMAAVGQLAAGVAHEIRNPLGIIRNYCYILKQSNENNEELKVKAIYKIESSVNRANNIIDNLLDFSSISGVTNTKVNMKHFFESILQLERKNMKEQNINITLHCPTDINIYTNEESLKHIFINLMSNSIDALNLGGNIDISCSSEDDVVNIRFKDDGIGIKDEYIDNIFEPFFTTKATGEGTGLGLFIVYNEVQKIGGEIRLETNTIGATFKIELPLKITEKSEI